MSEYCMYILYTASIYYMICIMSVVRKLNSDDTNLGIIMCSIQRPTADWPIVVFICPTSDKNSKSASVSFCLWVVFISSGSLPGLISLWFPLGYWCWLWFDYVLNIALPGGRCQLRLGIFGSHNLSIYVIYVR